MPVILSLLLLLLAGCATAPRQPGAAACAARFADIDARVERAGVRDADSATIRGFPFLRIDRLLASLVDAAQRDEAARLAWLGRLAALDTSARALELRALERDAQQRATLRAELDRCRDLLVARVATDAAAFDALRAAARVPDAYRRWQRMLGAYPLAARVAMRGVLRLQREENPEPRDLRDVPAGARVYAPPADVAAVDRRALAASLAAAPRDALDMPQPAPALLARLFAMHAPVWVVDHAGEADTIGRVVHDGATVRIDTTAPSVYHYPSFTRFEQRVLLQLNYVVWFSARPKSGPLDLLGGEIDGLTWRVTLDVDGEPLVHDSMHNCGCYHLWLPGPRLAARAHADDTEPAWIPFSVATTAPLALHLAAGTHYLRAVGAAPERRDATLRVRDYDALRSLPLTDGRRRSMFGTDGLVHESQRLERFVFWPFGIPSAGAMRTRGHHATAFVGRRHFDDAFAIERYFKRLAGDAGRNGGKAQSPGTR
jgi:hypothetical protein